MKNYYKNKQSGFTLIETIVYLALYGLIIGGVVVSVYAMFEASAKNQTKAMVQEEGTYLLGKIDWALTGATAVSVGATNEQLYVNKSGLPTSENPLSFDASGGIMKFGRGTSTPVFINNTNTTVTNPVFTRTLESSDGATPEKISTSFTLTALTPNGMPYSQVFSTTKYLRK